MSTQTLTTSLMVLARFAFDAYVFGRVDVSARSYLGDAEDYTIDPRLPVIEPS
nr:hypothetical protein [Actinomycetota bacterium]